jgi:hypothetical protein
LTRRLIILVLLLLTADSAIGQVERYDGSRPLHQWTAARRPDTQVLELPAGTYRLDGPLFVNGYTLRGADPDAPPEIQLGTRGVVWMHQAPHTLDPRAYIVATPNGSLALANRPSLEATPASFDVTDTPLAAPLHASRRITIEASIDAPESSGDLGTNGLFDLPYAALKLYDDPHWGRSWILETRLGTATHDLVVPTRSTRLWWRGKQTGGSCSLTLTLDLDQSLATLTVNGEPLTTPLPKGSVFPAIVNRRITIGAVPEFREVSGSWSKPDHSPGNLRITRFALDHGIGGRRSWLDLRDPAGPIIAANWVSGGPVVPVPHDSGTPFTWQGRAKIANLVIRGNQAKPGIHIGQAMARSDIDNVRIRGCGVGVRKLPGAVSYTHFFDRLHFENCGIDVAGDQLTLHATDWTSSYPRLASLAATSSNVWITRFFGHSGGDLQYAVTNDAGQNGGMLVLRDWMWNDEDGHVAAGALIAHGGSWNSAPSMLRIEGAIANVDPVTPAIRLGKSRAPGDTASIDWTTWGTPIIVRGDTWTIRETPSAKPLPVAPATP